MTTAVSLGTPLAEALSNVVQPKLVEMGWSSDGGEDSALTEYVILMLVNGKTQEQIAEELSNDLLNLGEGDTQAHDFSRWLFEQVETLNKQINGGGASSEQPPSAQAIPSFNDQETSAPQAPGAGPAAQDSEMSEAPGQRDAVPTGPKAMRNNRQGGRGRILGQINKAMDRGNDSMLHRVRGQPGAGRINTHGRDLPKGPRAQQGGRMGAGRHMGGMGMGMQGGHMHGGSPAGNLMQMSPENQMQLMALLEEQARMMAQLMPGMVPPAINPAFQQGGPQQGRSLFERVERQPHRANGSFAKRAQQHGISVRSPDEGAVTDGDMDTKPDQTSKDGEQGEVNTDAVCHWNLRCTKKDCPYAHQSPAAPEGTPIDVTDRCPFGPACKNKKCAGRHPSPALKASHQAEELCKYFPHCANPHCPFKHPSMPLCRNGADCTVPGCKFTHLQTPCKFHPCLNRNCPYKHVEGQKGTFADKVWTADSAEKREKSHVSERKFIADENAEEELIKPGVTPEGAHSEELVT
ncbi:hypothetical protein VTN00DRAFT_4759 [Thermoascus crustaceus]|uniref:uncharacterized protein n=1 Tax=Thermoascus crustaceus TaxID=5088 RepID=UPI003742AA23